MRARINAPLLLAIVIIALALAACGSEDGTSTTVGDSTDTSGGEVFVSSSTTLSSTTSSATTSTTGTGGESTTTTTQASSTTSESLSSAETRLPNGNIKAMGFIDEVWEEGGTRYISIDYAEMLTGPEAIEAAREAGELEEDDFLPNDYFIRNVNPMKREFAVSDSAVLTTATFGGGMEASVSWDVFRSFWTEFAPEGGQHMNAMPWWIERDGPVVVKIAEQYLP